MRRESKLASRSLLLARDANCLLLDTLRQGARALPSRPIERPLLPPRARGERGTSNDAVGRRQRRLEGTEKGARSSKEGMSFYFLFFLQKSHREQSRDLSKKRKKAKRALGRSRRARGFLWSRRHRISYIERAQREEKQTEKEKTQPPYLFSHFPKKTPENRKKKTERPALYQRQARRRQDRSAALRRRERHRRCQCSRY